jgi:FdhD protein
MSETHDVFSVNGREVHLDGWREVELSVPVERPLVVEVNGRPVATLLSLPGMERELAVGFCLSEGLIASFGDLLLVQYCRQEEELRPTDRGGAVVSLRARPEGVRAANPAPRRVLSGCGSVEISLGALELPVLPLERGPLVSPTAVWTMAAHLRDLEGTYRRAGAVHGAGLFDPAGTALVLAEDIGRHNALDKAFGAALFRGVSLADKVLLTTGRASHEVVTKALRMGVPIVGTFSAPTSLAVELAEAGHCTLLGRLRRQRFTIYTHPQRIA